MSEQLRACGHTDPRSCDLACRVAELERALAAAPSPEIDVERLADGAREFVAFAVEYLVLTLGEDHPTIRVGRRIIEQMDARLASKDRLPEDTPST